MMCALFFLFVEMFVENTINSSVAIFGGIDVLLQSEFLEIVLPDDNFFL